MPEKFTLSYWLLRAADAQAVADTMADPEAKRVMEGIAVGYQRLARHHAALAELHVPVEDDETTEGA